MGKQLQKINQGQAPTGAGGDSNRTQSGKINSNVDVLNSQAALNPAPTITDVQALTADHIGKRVNIQLAADGLIRLPPASVAGADCVMLLRNTGATVVSFAPADGAADTVALSKLNPAEAALVDTDGAHAWSVLMRGRAGTDNETVNGDLTVRGGGSFGVRPSFNGNTAWDTGNLKGPLTAADNLASVGNKTTARGNIGASVTLLGAQTISSSSPANSADFAGYFTSEFIDYELVFDDFQPVAGSAVLCFRVAVGGNFVATGSYSYGWGYINNNGQAFGGGATADTTIQLLNGQSAGASNPGQGASGTIRIPNPLAATNLKKIWWEACGINSTVGVARYHGAGFYNSTLSAITGVQLLYSGTPIYAGSVRLYGRRAA